MTLTWGQCIRGFTEEEVNKAISNVIKIKEKIIELNEKLLLKDTKKDIINDLIDRLEMSKNCIKYYYGLDINL
jgi:hypothetical protein